MILRLANKAIALLTLFLCHYFIYTLLVVLIVEVLRLSTLPLRFPWSLAMPWSFCLDRKSVV